MYYFLERVLGSPVALVIALLVGGGVLFWLRKRAEAREGTSSSTDSVAVPVHTGSISRPGSSGGVSLAGPGPTGLTADTKPTPGFRDLVWGDAPKPTMTLHHEDGDEALYMRATDKLKLGGVPLTSIAYSFYRSRFQGVSIEMPDTSAGTLHRYLVAEWGEPKQPNPHTPKYYWPDLIKGDQATQAVLEKIPISRKATLIITSKAIRDQKEKDKAK
jgi:hypothetical protein